MLIVAAGLWLLLFARPLIAQELGPHFQKIREGIYVYGIDDLAGRDPTSNCAIIITQEGVVLIDSGPNPPDSLIILKAVKQLTSLPIRFLINNEKLLAESSEMREAFRGFRVVPPHVEFNDRMILHMGDRTLELIQLKNIHSEADTAIWLPKERVLFSAATAAVKRFGFLRRFVTIENIKSDIKKLKALNPDIVVPAHGRPTTVQLLDETDKFYDVLLERVGKQIAQGKSVDEIKKDPGLPEYKSWSGGKERLDTNIEAAYRALKNQ
jgi:glyoxylase-like metal-dependent hydrolase (beta-lactamase superfamily II)